MRLCVVFNHKYMFASKIVTSSVACHYNMYVTVQVVIVNQQIPVELLDI